MERSPIKRKESKLRETTLVLIFTTLCVTTLNFYYYELINHKIKKVQIMSQILNGHMEKITKE